MPEPQQKTPDIFDFGFNKNFRRSVEAKDARDLYSNYGFNKTFRTSVAEVAGYKSFQTIVAVDGSGDYTNIQDALEAGKKRIFVKAGRYVLTKPIVIDKADVKITGEFFLASVLVAGPNMNDSLIVLGDGTGTGFISDITIENLYLHGHYIDQSAGVNHCIYGRRKLSQISIKNCFLTSPYRGSMIYFDGTTTGDFQNIKITDNIFSTSDPNAGVGQGNGILSDAMWKCEIRGNWIKMCSGDGIRILDPSTYCTIESNYIHQNDGRGIYIDADSIRIVNNLINSNKKDGIYTGASSGFIVISANQVTVNNTNPFTVSAEIYCHGLTSVTGNSVGVRSPGSTIGIYCNGDFSSITGNTLYDSSNSFTAAVLGPNSDYSIYGFNASRSFAIGPTNNGTNNVLTNNTNA